MIGMMSPDYREDPPAFLDFDSYGEEASAFETDVYVLIMNTLHAGLTHLSAMADDELANIQSALDRATDDEIEDHLAVKNAGVISDFGNQERFLRNMAVVALASRLTHALRKMARAADHFFRRKNKYQSGKNSEFERLWKEYSERFSIDFVANAYRIDFLDPMREVRNQIVHEGGEANPFKAYSATDFELGEEGYLDTRFSTAHPEFVSGTGMNAEVSVSRAQLE
jgi:hypothetical protein